MQAGKSKQTQRVYSSVQGILRTLVQRGIFEETGLPVDTGGLRKISQHQTGETASTISYLPITYTVWRESLCARPTSFASTSANFVLHCI